MRSIIALLIFVVVVSAQSGLPFWIPAGSRGLYEPYNTIPPMDPEDATASGQNVGVRFTVNIAGNVTGCSVYRHSCAQYRTCALFNSSGQIISNVPTFNTQTPGAGSEVPGACRALWEFLPFTPHVPITPGNTYTIAASIVSKGYNSQSMGFATSRTLGPITIPASGGVYTYGKASTPIFPTEVYNSEEYFISPLFKPFNYVHPFTQALYRPFNVVPTSANDNQVVHVGAKFSATVSGTIIGCAIYTPTAAACGTYGLTCDLWSSTGQQLFDITYPCGANNGGAGWNFAYINTPYAITANTTYTVSSVFQGGSYAYNYSGFATPRQVGNLRFPANAGVFQYGYFLPVFPTQTYQSSEYFVTPLFNPN